MHRHTQCPYAYPGIYQFVHAASQTSANPPQAELCKMLDFIITVNDILAQPGIKHSAWHSMRSDCRESRSVCHAFMHEPTSSYPTPPREPCYHRTCTLWGTEIAAETKEQSIRNIGMQRLSRSKHNTSGNSSAEVNLALPGSRMKQPSRQSRVESKHAAMKGDGQMHSFAAPSCLQAER